MKVQVISIPVLDQSAALQFYTEKVEVNETLSKTRPSTGAPASCLPVSRYPGSAALFVRHPVVSDCHNKLF